MQAFFACLVFFNASSVLHCQTFLCIRFKHPHFGCRMPDAESSDLWMPI